jgi:putative SbcD/Mre11-related phosphoesterase
MNQELKFVTGERAITIGRVLIVADLHVGLEYRYRKGGIAVPTQTGKMLERLESLVKKTKSEKIVILGDVKHKVPGTSFQEEKEVPAFFRRLLDTAAVEVCPGNHDGGIEKLLHPDVKLYPSSGFMLGDIWLCHGHAWPVEDFLGARHVVTGHNHPGIMFRDSLGYSWTEPVWIRAGLDGGKLAKRYKSLEADGVALPELVVMPGFNELAWPIAMNRKMKDYEKDFEHIEAGPGPLFRAAERRHARAFMLDGTLLGELGRL